VGHPSLEAPEAADATPADTDRGEASVEEPIESWLADVAAAPAVSLRPELGEVIDGVFRIEQPLGEGGMGVVYLAQDLTLDRKVAIKLHRVATARAADRMLGEARAAAKIAHENVLVVYEAGTWNGHVFIAMEYVDGWTARQWIHDAPRTWQQVVALYLEAGRGLAAAHAHGLVHRDVKPDNVLIARSTTPGGRGRARIADFGLARAASDAFDQSVDGMVATASARAVTDGIAGSPAYMAPEQLVRGDVDARADQYAFCVALHEGLFGRRPFEGAELSLLGASGSQGAIALPRDGAVPASVRRVLRRGLSPDPAARFPSMDALLAELGHDPEATRRRRLGLATAVVATGLVTWAAMRRPDPMAGCTETPAIDTWWTPAQATDLQAALRRSGRPFADDVFGRIDAALTAHTAAATDSLARACAATFVEGTRSSVELQGHRECLTQRGREVSALLEVLGEGDPEVVDRAMLAVDDLPPSRTAKGRPATTTWPTSVPKSGPRWMPRSSSSRGCASSMRPGGSIKRSPRARRACPRCARSVARACSRST
jgi:tRNA A-37 threonylcarbamoyl transferase component Bud32